MLKKSARGVFSFKGLKLCTLSLRGQNLAQMEILQGRTVPYMLHGDEGCAVLIVHVQRALGNLSMNDLLNSKKKKVPT